MMMPIFPHNRKWLAPVALAAEEPVTHLEVDLSFSETLIFQPSDDLILGLSSGQSIQKGRVYRNTIIREALPVLAFRWFHYLNHRQTKLFRKLEISIIVGWHCHNRASAIGREHIIGDPDGNTLFIDWVRSEEHT